MQVTCRQAGKALWRGEALAGCARVRTAFGSASPPLCGGVGLRPARERTKSYDKPNTVVSVVWLSEVELIKKEVKL